MSSNSKVTADHLKRIAYLYIRQSTLRQVFENTESTRSVNVPDTPVRKTRWATGPV